MKILNVELDPPHGFPWRDLVITVDHIPSLDEYRFDSFETDQGTVLYVAEHNDFVKFFAHNPNAENGFGGATFELTMRDGSVRTIKGPWSSRASVINEYFPELECTEVVLKTADRPNSRLHGAVRTTVIADLVDRVNARIERNGHRVDVVVD